MLYCHDFSIAQWILDKAQRKKGSAALVLGLILVIASVCFASVASVQIGLFRFDGFRFV